MTTEIKGCPFCGKKPEFSEYESFLKLSCESKFCLTVSVCQYSSKDKENLIEIWNRRI